MTLRVQKMAGANTVDVVDNVLQAIPKLTGIPQNVRLSLSFDQSLYIRQTISGRFSGHDHYNVVFTEHPRHVDYRGGHPHVNSDHVHPVSFW